MSDSLDAPSFADAFHLQRQLTDMELTSELRTYFIRAGWHCEWRVEVSESIPRDHPAQVILERYGGIHLKPDRETGLECGAADVAFHSLEHRREIVDRWQNLLATRLIGIAEASEFHEQLWMASDERVFSTNDVTDYFGYVGDTFQSAMLNMMTGVRHRPLLLPGETGVTYYGEHYLDNDPRVYNWEKYVG